MYYYFDNKDALLATVMDEIEARLLNAVPDRPLPQTREEYWQRLWDYRQRELDFFTEHPALGRVLIQSLGDREIGSLLDGQCQPLARLLNRHAELIRRGQELGALRGDLSISLIFELLRAADRVLSRHFFGSDIDIIETLSLEERKERLRGYVRLLQDLMQRMLTPEGSPLSLPGQDSPSGGGGRRPERGEGPE